MVPGSPWDWQQSAQVPGGREVLSQESSGGGGVGVGSGGGGGGFGSQASSFGFGVNNNPVILRVNANVSVAVGDTAYLPCRVKNLGDFRVSAAE